MQEHESESATDFTTAWNDILHGNYLSAYERLLELERTHAYEFIPGRLSLSMGIACHHLRKTDKGMLDKAIKHLSDARSCIDRTSNGVGYLQSHYLLAECYCDIEGYEQAYKLLVEAKDYLKYWDNQECASEYYWFRQLIGNVCLLLDKYAEAVQEYESAKSH